MESKNIVNGSDLDEPDDSEDHEGSQKRSESDHWSDPPQLEHLNPSSPTLEPQSMIDTNDSIDPRVQRKSSVCKESDAHTLGYQGQSTHSVDVVGASPPLMLLDLSSSSLISVSSSSTPDSVVRLSPSPSPPALTSPISTRFLESLLTRGSIMLKYPNKATSRPAERRIQVSLSTMELSWESKKKTKKLSAMDFHAIKEIRLGQNTKAFEIHGKRPDWEDRAFSIIYATDINSSGGVYKKLNLIAPTSEECLMWVTGLHLLLSQLNRSADEIQLSMPTWLKSIWSQVDMNGSGVVDLDQLAILMPRVNIHLSKSEIKSALKIANIPKTGSLPFEAFERLYRTLRFRPEIAELFAQIAQQKPSSITFDEFYTFLVDEQYSSWSEDRCLEIYEKFSSSDTREMSMDHFTAFLISSSNHIFCKSRMIEYQDMSHPLNHYFINTSHNTYLLGDQIRSQSSVEGYIHALQRGCRCIELDCWDGPNGQPVITHGHTLTSKLQFRDAIETIANLDQQVVMASVLRELFGEMLLVVPVHSEMCLPSPSQLKRKILVKAKCGTLDIPASNEEQPMDEEDEAMPSYSPISQSSNIPKANLLPSPSELTSRILSASTATAKKPTLVGPALAELAVYCKGTPLRGFHLHPTLLPFNQLYSISEKKMNEIIAKTRQDVLSLNQSHLTRVYPSVLRFDSSNFDPFPYWISGTSMVAMNFQTFDRGLQLSHALFEDNGRCGYVLKPAQLRNPPVSKMFDPWIVTIRIISGQQLPKQKDGRIHDQSLIPVCETEFISQDSGQGISIQRFKTQSSSRGNPANPLWKEECTAKISCPEFAFIRFQVFENESNRIGTGGDVLGSYAIPLWCLEKGYRHIPLHNKKGDRLRFSTLFVHIHITPESQLHHASHGMTIPSNLSLERRSFRPMSSIT